MAPHRDGASLGRGRVLERPFVPPTGPLVEGTGSCVPRNHAEPCRRMPVCADLPLGLTQQHIGDACSSIRGRDVDLLDLITDDDDEPGDGSVDDGDRRLVNAFRRPLPERFLGSCFDQPLRNEAEVSVSPSAMPELGDLARVLAPGPAKRHSSAATHVGSETMEPGPACPEQERPAPTVELQGADALHDPSPTSTPPARSGRLAKDRTGCPRCRRTSRTNPSAAPAQGLRRCRRGRARVARLR
jgi:hypothetical protein